MKTLHKTLVVLTLAGSLMFSSDNTSGGSLLQDLGAKGAGIAGAGVSMAGDVTFLKYNPAALASLKNPQLSLFYFNGGEIGSNFGSLTYGQKFGPGVIALAVSYLNGGQMELNFSSGVTQTVISQQDIIGDLSYALELYKDIEIGVSVKALASTLFGSLNAQTLCGDAGVQVKNILIENLNFGAAVLNVALNSGNGIKYLNTSELLPTNVAAGVSYSMAVDNKIGVLAGVDAVSNLNDNSQYLLFGTEVTYEDYALRAGLPLFSKLDTLFAVGLGFKINEFTFDYSMTFGKTLAATHKISVGMLFGEIKPPEVKPLPVQDKGPTIQDKGPSEYKIPAPKTTVPAKKPGVVKKEIK